MATKKGRIRPPGYTDIVHPETDADIVLYDNSASSLIADDAQSAIDEVDNNLDTHIADTSDPHDVQANQADYDNSSSGLTATNVQDAIDEVDGDLDAHKAENATEHNTIKTNLTKNTKNIRDIESTLRNVNVNNEATQEASGYSIFSLPKNASSAKAKTQLDGMTLVNSVENGDFSDGTAGWTLSTTSEWLYVENGYLVTKRTVSATGYVREELNFSPTDKIFYYFKFKEVTGNTTYIARIGGNYITSRRNTIFEEYYGIKSSHTNNFFELGVLHNNFIFEHHYDDAHLINMTALGIEDYTEEQMLDLVRSGYIDGLQNVENPVVESVGKNLFDRLKAINSKKVTSTGSITAWGNIWNVTDYIGILPNTNYRRSGVGNSTSLPEIAFYDDGKNFVGFTNLNSFTTPSNAAYCVFNIVNADLETAQLEEDSGQTLGEYEPYKSSQLTADVPLRRVPNGVADRVYESDGQMWLEKNVEEYVLQSGDIQGINTTYTNIDEVATGVLLTDQKLWTNNKDNTTIYEGLPEIAYSGFDLASSIGCYATASNQTLRIFVAKGTYASLAEAQADLVGTKIHYQLATPELINLTEQGLVSGQLLSQPSGTVYVSDKAYDAGVYDSGITITDTTYPIDEITTLSKVDFETGAETDLDISTAVIAGGGLSFTHPELADGDIVFFGYDFTNGSVPALTTVEYYDSRYVIEDSVTGTFYQWNVTVANGVSSIELVEV